MPGPAVAGPWCDDTRGFYRAGCPSSVLSCTAWGFSCLANYSASGELLPRLFTLACLRSGKISASPTSQRTGGMFSVTLSVNARPALAGRMLPAYFTRHAAVWCSDFPPTSPANAGLTSDHLPSAENLARRIRIWKPGSHEWDVLILNVKVGRAVLCAPLSLGHRRARSARSTYSQSVS